jgi:hypothetical protein
MSMSNTIMSSHFPSLDEHRIERLCYNVLASGSVCSFCSLLFCIGRILLSDSISSWNVDSLLLFFYIPSLLFHILVLWSVWEGRTNTKEQDVQDVLQTPSTIKQGQTVTDDVCPICLDEFQTGQSIIEACHVFHTDCLSQWVMKSGEPSTCSTKCPCCRQALAKQTSLGETETTTPTTTPTNNNISLSRALSWALFY